MAKAKTGAGIGMDPMSLLAGGPSFQGGTAGPSYSDGTQTSSISIGSPFAVGSGASSNAENTGGATATTSATAGLNNVLPWALLALAVVAFVKVAKK